MKLTNIVLPTLLVLLLCLVTTVALRQSRMSNEIPPLASELPVAAVTQGASERGPVRMIRFVLLDTGLYPRTMGRRTGRGAWLRLFSSEPTRFCGAGE